KRSDERRRTRESRPTPPRPTDSGGGRMNTLLAVIIGALTVYLAYTLYARRIDRHVIQSDPKRATPATLYMDGVDFMPTNRNILFGYHFKSIAAAGPIIGAIVAANLWGWLPAIIWLILGVSFLGWASDYSGIVISVRNDGNSLSAIAHRLVAPLVTYFDPTLANFKGADAKIMPSLLFWALAISAFCYAGSVLPIWRMAQPVIYVGFWITALAMVLGLTGALVAPFAKPEVAQ